MGPRRSHARIAAALVAGATSLCVAPAATGAPAPRVAVGAAVAAPTVVGVGELRRVDARRSFGAGFARYRQYVRGLPVLGTDTVLTGAAGRRGDLLLDGTRRLRRAPARATVARARAIAVARTATAVDLLRAAPTAAKAVAVRPGGARVVWRVVLPAARPLGSFEVLVDARSAAVLGVRDLLRRAFTATGQASVFDTNPVVAQGSRAGLADNGDADSAALTALREEVPLARLETAVPGCLEGRWVHVTIPAGEVCDAGRDFRALTRADDGFEAAMAYFHLDRAQEHIRSLGFANVRADQQRVHADEIFVDEDDDPLPPAEQDNSFYDPATGEISLGTGGVDDGEDGEVIVHEYGHAVQDDQVPGWGESDEGGAMGEGFGDYLAATIAAAHAPSATFDPCIAEWDQIGFEELLGLDPADPPCLRRVDRSLTPEEIAACDGEVHCAGEAWSGALWAIRGQLGATTTDRLVIQSHFSLTPTASFHDGSLALLAADQALSGGVHVPFLRGLLAARGLLDVERLDDEPGGATPLGPPGHATGAVAAGDDEHDVYALALTAGRGVVVRLSGSGGELDLRLLRPGTTSVGDAGAVVAAAESAGPNETLSFTPATGGIHYLDVAAIAGGGSYTVDAQPDGDGDLRADAADNCPSTANSDQADGDRDGIGDACDRFPADPANDRDRDGLAAADDNCPGRANRAQRDWDGDGRGDVCDRSARVTLRRVRLAGRTLTLRATLRPTLLGRRAVRIAVARRACAPRCHWRAVRARVRVRPAGSGRVRIALRLPVSGAYRVGARLVDRRYAKARSRPLRVAVR